MNFIKRIREANQRRKKENEEKKRQYRTADITEKATKLANEDYNIARIDGTDYIVYCKVPISCKEDNDGMPMCDRLEIYRQNYVAACVKAGKVIGVD